MELIIVWTFKCLEIVNKSLSMSMSMYWESTCEQYEQYVQYAPKTSTLGDVKMCAIFYYSLSNIEFKILDRSTKNNITSNIMERSSCQNYVMTSKSSYDFKNYGNAYKNLTS